MNVINLNDNNNMANILNNIQGGKLRKCVLSEDNIERLSPIIRLAHNIEQDDKEVFIEVKFDTKFSPRPKRLEVVAKNNTCIEIYKFSKKSSFEKECLEIQRVIDELRESYTNVFCGYIVVDDINEDITSFENRVNEITTDIKILRI